MTMTLVETVTVTATTGVFVEFFNIPQSGKDLMLQVSGRSTTSNNYRVRPNNNTTASNYSRIRLYGDGSSVGSDKWVSGDVGYFGDLPMGNSSHTANTFGNGTVYIANYTSSSGKSMMADNVGENNATEAPQQLDAGLWNSSDAITSLTLVGNFGQHSVVSLYIIS